MSIRPLPTRSLALLLLLPLAAGCRDDSPATLPSAEAPASAQTSEYVAVSALTARDLGTLGGSYSIAQAISGQGMVVGWSQNAAGQERAFAGTAAGGLKERWGNRAWDVNASGQVVGESGGYAFGARSGWPGAALGINSRGTAAAGYRTGSSGDRAVIDVNGAVELGLLPGGTYSHAEEVNDSLLVVGHGSSSAGTRAFIVRYPGPMQSLGVLPGGTDSGANAVNNAGQVVGYSTVSGKFRAFVWTAAGGMKDLGTLPGGGASRAYDINAGGEIVGYAVAADGKFHAVLWTPSGAGYTITDLGGIGGAYPSVAHGINDAGRVVGYSRAGAANHATIWLPASIPPVARISGPDTIWAGTPAEFSATGSADEDGTLVGYEWGFNSAGTFNYSTQVPRIQHAFALPGTRVAYVRVRDNEGALDTAAMTLVVIPNHPPVAEIGQDTFRVLEGGYAEFTGAASSDPDVRQPLRYGWAFGNGAWSARMVPESQRYLTRGTYTVSLTVTDASGASDIDEARVVVVNAPPRLLLETYPVLENTPIILKGYAHDTGGPFDYATDCGSGYSAFGSYQWLTTCPAMPEGASVNVGAKVRDRDGVIVEQRLTVTAMDAPPEVGSVSIATQNGTLTLTFSFSDPGAATDGPYRYRVVWGDGTATNWVPASPGTVQVSRPAYAPGTYTIHITVLDGAGVAGVRRVTNAAGSAP
jgi:probable HAF family extracellular repeat protein